MRVLIFSTLFLGTWCCPSEWWRQDFNGTCYLFSHDVDPWTGANQSCHGKGGKLVEIETAAENAYLTSIVDSLGRVYWIGLSDIQDEGIWMWMDSKVKLSTTGFSSWFPGEPNNRSGDEKCATLNFHSGGKWTDRGCSGEAFYICETIRKDDVYVG